MLPDGTYTGVVDRFEEATDGTELAVVLLEEEGEVIEQVDLPREHLPSAAGQDAVLELTVNDGSVDDVTFRPEETQSRAETAQRRFDRLARRPPNESEPDSTNDSGE